MEKKSVQVQFYSLHLKQTRFLLSIIYRTFLCTYDHVGKIITRAVTVLSLGTVYG